MLHLLLNFRSNFLHDIGLNVSLGNLLHYFPKVLLVMVDLGQLLLDFLVLLLLELPLLTKSQLYHFNDAVLVQLSCVIVFLLACQDHCEGLELCELIQDLVSLVVEVCSMGIGDA